MDTTKLREALVELQQQKSVLDGAIANIQRAIAVMEGGSKSSEHNGKEEREYSYLDDAVNILRVSGHPLHIDEIVKKISEMRGQDTERPPIESSFSRHITKSKKSRIVRTKPGYYGLPEWKTIIVDKRADNAA